MNTLATGLHMTGFLYLCNLCMCVLCMRACVHVCTKAIINYSLMYNKGLITA